MAKGICLEVGCEKAVLAKALCVTHYHRANRETKNERPTVGICRGCGESVPRDQPGPPKHYCGPDCRPRCNVKGCDKPQHGVTYCSAHHTRWKRFGDPLAPRQRQSNFAPRKPRQPKVKNPCSVEGCGGVSRKLGWCASHYGQWRRSGEVSPFAFKWADEAECLICGKPNGDFRSRKYCSAACQMFASRWRGRLPANPECSRCGIEIDLLVTNKNGRKRRADSKLCRRCKHQHRTEATPGELARRDGPYCQLCGCDVDLLAVFPDIMRPSVDHIIPRAWGGSDAASNNQLTHLLCNQIKSDRYEGVSSRSNAALGRAGSG